MRITQQWINSLVGVSAAIFVGAHLVPGADQPGPVTQAIAAVVADTTAPSAATADEGTSAVASSTNAALSVLASAVRRLSHPKALESAFHSYFAFKASHPDDIKKPYLYYVDYGLPSTEPRGYVFDMSALKVVDGPFTVAHGRGSSTSQYGIPTRFSNASGSAATSLGLYLTGQTYGFVGHTGGRAYSSIGLKLLGQSKNINDNALARGVVAHGAPYVSPSRAGRSEGCPAVEPQRAKELLPKLANGSMVFLFAPDQSWMSRDPWVTE